MNKTLSYWAVAVFALSAGCAEHHLNDYYEFPEEITRLQVNVDSADVLVKPATDENSIVDMDVDYRGGEPDWDVDVSGTTLKVSLKCDWNSNCDGDFRIAVPPTVLSNIKVDAGNVTVRDLEGNMSISADAGNIKLENIQGNLDMNADAGNISGSVGSDRCIADLDAGNFQVTFNNVPTEVDVAADAGNVTIHVPTGAYNVTAKVDAGNKRINQITLDKNSPNIIYAEVDAGNLTITGF